MRLLTLLVLIPGIASACAPRAADRGRPASTMAIIGVTLIDVNGARSLPDMSVVIEEGRVQAIGPASAVTVPAGARVVSGRGKFLIPGLWDAHVHLTVGGPQILPLFVAYGVTSVRDLGGRFDDLRTMRARVDSGALVGPRILTSGPVLEGAAWMQAAYQIAPPGSPIWVDGPRVIVSRANAERVVDSLVTAGVDFVKARNVWGDDFLALAAATERAGIPLASHNPNRVDMVDAAGAGLDSFEHAESIWGDFDTLSVPARQRMFERVARTGALVVPTLMGDVGLVVSSDSAIATVLADTFGMLDVRNRSLPAPMRRAWREATEVRRKYGAYPAGTFERITSEVRAMHKAGIPMLAGTDVGSIPRVYAGSSLHEELELLVREGGLSPMEALQSATRNPPRFFGPRHAPPANDPLAVGAVADLVLLDADPLADIGNVRTIFAVVLRGRLFDRAALDALIAGTEREVGPTRR